MSTDTDIREVDVVELTEAIGHWPAGSQGTVVGEYGDSRMLEMAGDTEDPLDLPVAPVAKLKLISKHRPSAAATK